MILTGLMKKLLNKFQGKIAALTANFSHEIRLKAAQPVSHSGIKVRIIRTKAHSLGSSITQPESHRFHAIFQCSELKISKYQLRSIITRIPSRKKMLQKIPTIIILININTGFKLFSQSFSYILLRDLLIFSCIANLILSASCSVLGFTAACLSFISSSALRLVPPVFKTKC